MIELTPRESHVLLHHLGNHDHNHFQPSTDVIRPYMIEYNVDVITFVLETLPKSKFQACTIINDVPDHGIHIFRFDLTDIEVDMTKRAFIDKFMAEFYDDQQPEPQIQFRLDYLLIYMPFEA